MRWNRMCDYLIAHGYASPAQIAEAKKFQQTTGGDLPEILIGMGLNARDVYAAKAAELLGDYMVEKGYASPEQIEDARKAQQSTRGDLAKILIALGLNPRDVYEAKAQEMQVPFVDLTVYRPDQSAVNIVPEHVARRHNVLPIKKDGNTLYVAMPDVNNVAANDDIRLISRCTVRGVLAVPEHIADSINRLYG